MEIYERKLCKTIEPFLKFKEFIIITGARQTGKTSLMKLLSKKLSQDEPFFSFSLEDPNILKALDEHPVNLFNYVPTQEGQRSYVFIDEITYLKNPTNFLKYHYDLHAEKLKIIATGSSAFYIDTNFKDSLVGRKLLFEIHPLDFDEFLVFKNADKKIVNDYKKIKENPNYIGLQRPELLRLFNEHLTFGGYPAVVLQKSEKLKIHWLREIMNTYIRRDVLESGITQTDKFYALMKILAAQCGNLVNANELSKTLGISLTAVNNYLYILQKCFHICLVKPYFRNVQKELTKMPKVYFNDLGLRNTFLNNFGSVADRTDKGELIENYVFSVLRNKYEMDNLFFWRTADGNEVDFVVDGYAEDKKSYEVKFNTNQFKPLKYKKFVTAYPELPLQCIGYESKNNADNIISL
jgi:predicted AAA+ superfamily ATPase